MGIRKNQKKTSRAKNPGNPKIRNSGDCDTGFSFFRDFLEYRDFLEFLNFFLMNPGFFRNFEFFYLLGSGFYFRYITEISHHLLTYQKHVIKSLRTRLSKFWYIRKIKFRPIFYDVIILKIVSGLAWLEFDKNEKRS